VAGVVCALKSDNVFHTIHFLYPDGQLSDKHVNWDTSDDALIRISLLDVFWLHITFENDIIFLWTSCDECTYSYC